MMKQFINSSWFLVTSNSFWITKGYVLIIMPHHTLKEFINNFSVSALSCILVTRHENIYSSTSVSGIMDVLALLTFSLLI
jgi:hypothetical protein